MNRLFLSLPVTLFDYQDIQDDFKHALEGRWVPQKNLHLTVQFFSNLYEEEVLIEKLSSLELKAEASDVRGLELFSHNPNILYAKTQNYTLNTMHALIHETFSLPPEPAFIPHVTLVRIKKIKQQTLFEQKLKLYTEKLIGTVHPNLQLVHSRLTPEGSKYTVVQEFKV